MGSGSFGKPLRVSTASASRFCESSPCRDNLVVCQNVADAHRRDMKQTDRPSAPSAFRIDGVLSFRHQVGMIGSTPLRLGGKRERGGVRQHRIRGCPRNCKRRVRLTMPLERSGKASQGGEPQARRPAGHASNHNVFGCEDKEVGP